jgi:DNA (cytosine-5)-methyltransferase 1
VIEHVEEPPSSSFQAISLFSGAGGDTTGLERAGYTVVAFNEFNEAAVKTHTTVFPSSTALVNPTTGKSDIKQVPDSVFEPYRGRVNVVFGGFPCQGFSHAGKKKSDDARNELVHEFARVARIVQPKWIIGENVKGLLARKGKDPYQPADAPLRPVIDIIRDLFERTGYKISYKVIDATTIGVPQHRKRLIIVGHRGTLYPHVPWDDLTPASTPLQTNIRSFLDSHLDGAMILPALYTPEAQLANYWISTTETAPTGTPHPNLVRLVRGIRNPSTKEKQADPAVAAQIIEPAGLISFGVRKGCYHGMIVNPDAACNTIISTYNLCPRLFVGLHNPATNTYWIRTMTPKELGQIQGFPADYAWQGTQKEQIAQIGNAVPPPLAERVARSLPRVLFKPDPQLEQDIESEDEEEEENI